MSLRLSTTCEALSASARAQRLDDASGWFNGRLSVWGQCVFSAPCNDTRTRELHRHRLLKGNPPLLGSILLAIAGSLVRKA